MSERVLAYPVRCHYAIMYKTGMFLNDGLTCIDLSSFIYLVNPFHVKSCVKFAVPFLCGQSHVLFLSA